MRFRIPSKARIIAKKTIVDGIKFDSITEAEFYSSLKLDPSVIHIDCHVPLTLPGGIRLNIDFIVYKKGDPISIEAIEVKGFVKEDFKRLRQLFDETHPLGPMLVFQKKNKKWDVI